MCYHFHQTTFLKKSRETKPTVTGWEDGFVCKAPAVQTRELSMDSQDHRKVKHGGVCQEPRDWKPETRRSLKLTGQLA